YGWTIDTTPPETRIDSAPVDLSSSRSAELSFSADEAASFVCSLDGAPFADCSSPVSYEGLAEGLHVFDVRAIDLAGNGDPSPARAVWTIDLTPPETTIDAGPADPTNSTSARLEFSANEMSSFECRLDGGAFAPCSSPVEHGELVEGAHLFEVRAIDQAGNVEPEAAGFGWTVDLTAPETAIDAQPPDPANSSTATFGFSAGEEEATFACSLDGAPFAACSSPASYDGLAEGVHTFDVRAIDQAGNSDTSPARATWTIDLTPPEAAIDAEPGDPTNSTSATFEFSADEASTFECRLDGAPFAACTSPATYEGLAEGVHAFDVRAIDRAGNADPAPARSTWRIDLTPPETTIDVQPPDPTASSSASFEFSADEVASFECRLDDGAFVPCASPAGYEGLAEGRHRFEVRATDQAGNLEPDAALAEWTVDLTPPETAIDSHPADPSTSSSAAFGFSADEEGTFMCSLDGAPYAACSSPASYEGLGEGLHSFEVRAVDRAGNVDASPAAFSWTIDLTPPQTEIDAGPADPTANTSATFEFSAGEASTFECRLDDGAFSACASPQAYAGLAEGSHTFDVRATDRAGNVDSTPARATWTIDLTPPETSIDAQPADPTSDTSATFAFSADEGGTFECSLDDAPFAGCSSPTSYAGLGEGRHTFAVRAVDRVGHVDPTPAGYAWTVDRTAPETAIEAGPPDPTNSTSAHFSFSSDEPGSTFACSLDGSAFQACGSGATYTDLEPGTHSFHVRATDAAGNTDPTPAAHTWTIDLTLPETAIAAGPGDPTNATSATFEFSANEAASFECRLDDGAFSPCASPHSYAGLAEGSHAFDVRAIDPAGNVDSSPARFSWMIDLTPPATTIDSGPADPTNATAAGFTFSADEAGATFACSLDGAPFAPCSSPASYDALGEGVHSLAVRATDRAGNTDESAATHAWRIDTTPPQTTIDAGPADPTNSAGATFEFSAGEAASLECRLDGERFAGCSSPQLYGGLAEGAHTFEVRAIDLAGNPDPTPAAHTWTVDQTPPNTTIVSGPPPTTSDTSAVFTFSSSEAGSTFECSLDGSTYAACGSPREYAGLSVGPHEFRVRANDAAANTDGSPAVHAWTIEPPPDPTAPETTIDSGPPALTASTSASFVFSADAPGSTFECSLDAGAFAGCASPQQYTGLGNGGHEFRVRATDPAGNVDPTPAVYSWTVDTEAPETAIDAGPPALTSSTSATFSFSASETGSTFECSLDGAAFAVCTSPRAYTDLAGGSHQFRVRARDAAGNVDATPAAHGWTVDIVAPETTISSGPPALASSTSASFSFVANELGSTFECSLDSAAFASCSSPRSYTGLADGAHQFLVRATDPAGNVDATPAARSWTIDTVAPETAIDSAPPATTTSTGASFSFSASEPGSTFECSLDGATFAGCASPRQYSGLAVGAHQFRVRATDPAGNTDGSPASHGWTIAAPSATCPGPTTVAAVADAWIDENSASSNKGDDSILKIQSKGPRDNFRALVRFSLPAVPPGCAVDAATLRLFAASMKPGRVLQAARLAAAWAENTVSWNTQPPTTGAAATTTSGFGYREWDVSSQVQAMVADGASHGFLIRDAIEGQDAEQQFHSREKGESPPQLVVRFAASG
ncbi:MAG TPA: DNRLRE domain-containing protein, partial [Gaiellaceae bacterium]